MAARYFHTRRTQPVNSGRLCVGQNFAQATNWVSAGNAEPDLREAPPCGALRAYSIEHRGNTAVDSAQRSAGSRTTRTFAREDNSPAEYQPISDSESGDKSPSHHQFRQHIDGRATDLTEVRRRIVHILGRQQANRRFITTVRRQFA